MNVHKDIPQRRVLRRTGVAQSVHGARNVRVLYSVARVENSDTEPDVLMRQTGARCQQQGHQLKQGQRLGTAFSEHCLFI
ncbi:MAG: hypothetical protein ACRDRU_16500 [Pseudonocardiaceae bacterium]